MRKQRIISVLLTLCMAVSLLSNVALAASVTDFTDVAKDSWYYTDVDFVAQKGYFKGMSATTFEPDTEMSRAMFVTVLARYAGAKVNDSQSAFTDVPTGTWYTGAVNWAAQKKIVEGRGNGIFDPNASVTREEMCTILDRYLTATREKAKLTRTPAKITDLSSVSDWAKTAVSNCVSYGVILGYPDGTFQPKTTATRAHVAAILHRLKIVVSGGGSSGGDDPTPIPTSDLTALAVAAAVAVINNEIQNANIPEGVASVAYANGAINASAEATLTEGMVDTAKQIVKNAVQTARAIIDLGDGVTRAELREAVNAVIEDVFGYDISDTSIRDLGNTIVDEIMNETTDLRTDIRTALQNFNGDYAFDRIHVVDSVKGELFSIDFSDGVDRTSIDLPEGVTSKKVALKNAAIALAKQLRAASVAYTDWTNSVEGTGTLTLDFDVKAAVLADEQYDCTESFTLNANISLTDETNTVQYKWDGKDCFKIAVPEAAKNAYNTAMQRALDYVIANGGIGFAAPAAAPVAVAYAFDMSSIDVNKYLTPEVVQALVNGENEKLYDVMDQVLTEVVTVEDVNQALRDYEVNGTPVFADDVTVENLAADLAQDSESSMTKFTTSSIIAAATSKVNEILNDSEYAEVVSPEIVDYAALTVLNNVFSSVDLGEDDQGEKIVCDTFTEKAEAAKEVAKEVPVEGGDSPLDKLVNEVVRENETVKDAVNTINENPAYKALVEIMTYDSLCQQTFNGIANALNTTRLDDRGNNAVATIMDLLDQYSINVPAGTSVKVGNKTVTNAHIQALRNANTTKEVRLALQAICTDLGDLSINSFADGLDVIVAAGSYSYTCNVTIVA